MSVGEVHNLPRLKCSSESDVFRRELLQVRRSDVLTNLTAPSRHGKINMEEFRFGNYKKEKKKKNNPTTHTLFQSHLLNAETFDLEALFLQIPAFFSFLVPL